MSNSPVRKKYKVVYDRNNCIGAGSCVAIFPRRWIMNNADDKADLVGGKKDEKEMWIFEFTLEELEDFKSSAEVCPVQVIHIYDLESGEKLV